MGAMTRPETRCQFSDGIAEAATASGRSPEAAAALADLDRTMFHWTRRVMKGELAGRLLASSGEGIELSQFHALTAITRIERGVARTAAEPATVGLLADEMQLDPSRASRVAADLVARGLVRREAAQEDGRRTVLTLTPEARAILARVHAAKAERVQAVFAEWDDAEVREFARLFGRYVAAVLGDPPAG